ncbi:MAG: pentapeptide repeat-containing protein [Natrinema limicola]
MDELSQDHCGYIWPEDYEGYQEPIPRSCCYRPTLPQSDHCVWHTDSEKVNKKEIAHLESTRVPSEVREQNSPVAELLDGANLADGTFTGCQFKRTGFRGADFSNADLQGVDLSGSDLRWANFSGANLEGANLSETDLRYANLTNISVLDTNFQKSDLRHAELGNDDEFPSGADFTGADLRGIEFPDDLNYVQFSNTFIFENPIDWDPERGIQNTDDIVSVDEISNMTSDLKSSEYFGPPTEDIGRYVCMEKWPNVKVEEATTLFGWTADFSGKAAILADFSGSHLWGADFSDSFLEEANFSNSTLWSSDFSNANLRDADLTEADLRGANLTEADLRDADLTGADLRRADLSRVTINGGTKCEKLFESEELIPEEWNSIARSYHALKELFAENGIVGNARTCHILERRARGLEAKSRDGLRSSTYLGTQLSKFFTGYGIRIQPLLFWMVLLFSVSTFWYIATGVEDNIVGNLSYSVITFTTSAPHIPSENITQGVIMVETFFGTLFVVLLGYILGNREQF